MGAPNIFLPIALVAFVLATAACFSLFAPRRAVLSAMLGGWMFLPHFDNRLVFFVVNSKAMFVPAVVLLGSIAFDSGRWRQFRPGWLDLPVAVLTFGQFATALHNDLGVWEAGSATLDAAMTWGAPFVLGRLYLGQPRALRDLATALVVAALVYAPLCLWEVRMSPQLQFNLYGFRSEGFDTVVRFGGYRPSVFMQTGLALGMFMAAGTLCAIWLWRTGGRQTLGRIPLSWVCIALAVTTIVCKSTGAIILLALGLAVLEATRHLRSPVLLVALAAIPSVYCAARISGWNADALVALSRNVSEERAGSVQFRIHNETLLIRKAMLRPWLGWGRFGRSFVYFEEGGLLTTVDSMWIAEFGVTGLMGLVAIVSLLALPPLVLLRTYQARHWADPRLAAAAVLSVAVLLWAIDDLFNRMMSPVFPAIAGALVSFVVMARAARTWRGRATHAPAPRLALERHPPA